MLIFNPRQADYLFQAGVKIIRIVKGEKDGRLAILFDKLDPKFNETMLAWKNMCEKNKR